MILCDNCRREFNGKDWMMETTGEVLCHECRSEFDEWEKVDDENI
mgnify:CR=1 FL=1